MKTIKSESIALLETAFFNLDDLEHLTDDLYLYITNDERFVSDLVKDRRKKVHSIAFYGAICYAVEFGGDSRFKGYNRSLYVNNEHFKAFCLTKWEKDYKDVLADLCKALEKYRNDHL